MTRDEFRKLVYNVSKGIHILGSLEQMTRAYEGVTRWNEELREELDAANDEISFRQEAESITYKWGCEWREWGKGSAEVQRLVTGTSISRGNPPPDEPEWKEGE